MASMNTDEIKSELWTTLFEINGFKESVGLQKNKEVFETVISEMDQFDLSLTEKKKRTIDEFILRIIIKINLKKQQHNNIFSK